MLCVCFKLVSPVSLLLHNLGGVFISIMKIVIFILFHKIIPIVLSIAYTCFLTFVTHVSMTPKKTCMLDLDGKTCHGARWWTHIYVRPLEGSFLHYACVFVLVCCKTLTFEVILVVEYLKESAFLKKKNHENASIVSFWPCLEHFHR